jgi:ABC-2 type transport system permease protein
MFEIFHREFKSSLYSLREWAWLVAAAIAFSILAYLLLTDKEMSLLDQGESLFLLTQIIISLGLVMSAASASYSISGERETGTLESLLLAPIGHRQIVAEKLLHVLTIWILMFLVSIPYLIVIASGTNLAVPAIFYVGIYGTLLVIAVSSIGIILSIKLDSKGSIMTALMIVLILLAPSLFFATSLKNTDFGAALESINPVSHAINSLDSVIVDNETAVGMQLTHLFPVIIFSLLFSILLLAWYGKHLKVTE